MAYETNNQNTPMVQQPIEIPVVPPPVRVQPETLAEQPKPKRHIEDLSDLTSLSADDREFYFGTDGIGSGVEEAVDNDIDDLINVSDEDVMGKPPPPRRVNPSRLRRTAKHYNPPSSMRGIQI